MRSFRPAPDAAVDAAGPALLAGSYRGAVDRVDYRLLEPRALRRFFREKRWLWSAISTADVHVAFGVVDLGYALSAFADAALVRGERFVVSRSFEAPPFAGGVRRKGRDDLRATFLHPRAVFRIEQRSAVLHIDFEVPDLVVHARVDLDGGPPPLTAIASLPEELRPQPGSFTLTEKRAAVPVTGSVVVRGNRYEVGAATGALAGLDYSHGLLPRNTTWHWAFAQGFTEAGVPFGLNLVDGFVGEDECALFLGGDLVPLAEGRIEPAAPGERWAIGTRDDAVALTFDPIGELVLAKNLGLVKSAFRQPVGTFSGAIRLEDGAILRVKHARGVVERQEVRW